VQNKFIAVVELLSPLKSSVLVLLLYQVVSEIVKQCSLLLHLKPAVEVSHVCSLWVTQGWCSSHNSQAYSV